MKKKKNEPVIPPSEEEQGNARDELKNELQNLAGLDESLARDIAENWQKLVGALLVMLVFVWLIGKYRESQETELAKASQFFSQVQSNYRQLLSTEEEKEKAELAGTDKKEAEGEKKEGEEAVKSADKVKEAEEMLSKSRDSFRSSVNLVEQYHKSTIYGDFARLYDAQRLIESGRSEEAKKALADNFDIEGMLAASAGPDSNKLTGEHLLREIAALLSARASLAQEATKAEGLKALEALARQGKLVNVEALLSLFRLERDEAKRGEYLGLAQRLILNRPDLADILRRELRALGVSLPAELS